MKPGQPVKVIRLGLYHGDEGVVESIKNSKYLIKFKETAVYFTEDELEINGEAQETPTKIRTLFKGLPNTK